MAKATAPSPYKGFNIDDAKLPTAIDEAAHGSGGYPHDKKLKRDAFETELETLQIELLKLQAHITKTKARVVVLFEGRDAAGKGTCIGRMREHLNPRHARVVALTKPTETERGQWYFQRYTPHMPTRGDIVMFDRSWYNRAGVERVMGFCSSDELADFLRDAPEFEGMLVRDGIHVFKFYLEIGREMQLKRFHERRHDPFKMWKITPIDLAAIGKWEAYTEAETAMLKATHKPATPWTVVHANDQKRARLEVMRVMLTALDYAGKDSKAIGKVDGKIAGSPDKIIKLK